MHNFYIGLIKICMYNQKYIFESIILKATSYINNAIIDKQF